MISKNKTILLSLYNPGQAQKREIRVAIPEHELKIVDEKNNQVPGDIFCANLEDISNCEAVFWLDMPESGNKYVKLIPQKSSSSATTKIIKLHEMTII